MADGLYQFDVDDDSPEIAYFPFVNLEPSPNVSAGWELMYTTSGVADAPGQVGNGSSYHYTTLNGASFMISWNGTGIDLVGSVSEALYNITLDGDLYAPSPDLTNSMLASFDNLGNTNHSLLLTTHITDAMSPNAYLIFDKAVITYAPPAGVLNTTVTSQPVSDFDIAFMGLWSFVTSSTGNMHVSNSAGDNAQLTFTGSAITIYGLTSSYSGNFTVSLDNITTNLSALSSYNNSNTLLFYATDLAQNMSHSIVVTNQENRTLALRAGGVNITSFEETTTSSPASSSSSNAISAGTIAAIVLAIVLFLVIAGILYYVCRIRRKARAINRSHAFLQGGRVPFDAKYNSDIERVTSLGPPSGEELESTSLSTSKGYGFGLGLRRGLILSSRKNKLGSYSSGRSRNGTIPQADSNPMTLQHDRDEKRISMFTLTEDLPVLEADALESEKLAPGWSNPVARTPPSFRYSHSWRDTQAMAFPDLHMGPTGPDDGDDADVKTLTSRQDEALAATLLLSPRTSEAPGATGNGTGQKPVAIIQDVRPSDENRRPEFLQVRDISPFRIDVSAVFGSRKAARDSKRSSGSSSWSKVRARLYRRAHRDDGRQSTHADKQETSSSSGPESVPVVMHESANPPSEAAPESGTYSFLDLASSRVSLGRHSKATTLSSTPAELGHGAKETSAWSENTSVRMVRIERSRDNVLAPKPDAPSTASGGSQPSDSPGSGITPSAKTTHTQSSHFSFPVTIPPSSHITHPPEQGPERHITPSPPPVPPSQSDQYLQVPQIAHPEPATPPNSPTESVPFSVSDIHFRHSFSDYAGLDSQRASVTSVLPPHPPLPHLDGSQATTPTLPPPPPYIVQRVLGLSMSPLSPLSPAALMTPSRMVSDMDSPTLVVPSAGRPGTASSLTSAPSRVGSLLGPRPRPSTAGSVRVSVAPQLPMQGGRSGLRSPRP